MPAWRDRLSDEDIDLVLTYITTMWTPQERAVLGQITSQQCG